MGQFLIAAGWIVSGLFATGFHRRSSADRLAQIPIALVFGPLWAAVALEQRQVAQLTGEQAFLQADESELSFRRPETTKVYQDGFTAR